MVAGTPLTAEQVAMILTLLRKRVESHAQIAAGMNLSRHTVHRIARMHGIPNGKSKALRMPPNPPGGDDLSWQDRAECRGCTWWDELTTAEKKKFCADCEVREPCLERGIRIDDRWDVYGGLGPNARRKLKRLRQEVKAS